MMTNAEFDRECSELEAALTEHEEALLACRLVVREMAESMGCTRPATPDESRPVELPRITPPRLPTGVDGEGVPPVYGVRNERVRR